MTYDSPTDSAVKSFDSIREVYSQYIVRPLNAFGLAGFVFDVEGATNVQLSSEITDHYTETNSAIQDHIALRPKRVTLGSYVGELVDRRDESTDSALQDTVRKLTVIDSYLPALSKAATQAKQLLDAEQADLSFNNILNTATDIWALTRNLNPPIPRQQQAYMFFKALRDTKQLVSVQTPFEFMTNMAVETIVANQGEGTRWISDFSITLKEIRTVSVRNVPFDFVKNYQGATAQQRADVSNGGKVQGENVNNSILYDFYTEATQ